MCRIAGIINFSNTQHQVDVVASMCDIMQNGGPDDAGVWKNKSKKVTLGNRRLALVDLTADGHQPMHYQDGLTITFNGEIYNYKELKKELVEIGCSFNNETDTEVILAAYHAWGTKSFEKLQGMFAFVLLDDKNQKTYLVRDPVGIKPLYYTLSDKELVFASEIKAFEPAGYTEMHAYWKLYFLAFGFVPEPLTQLKDVYSLKNGYFMEVDLETESASTQPFFQFSYNERVHDKHHAEKLLHSALKKAVKKHLIADAPVGLFLSGGIDSSILALLADQCTKNLTTISVNFGEAAFSEQKYQQLIHDRLLSKYVDHTLEFDEFKEHFPEALSAMDQPSNDGINTWFISRYARANGLKGVLSGIGADEFLGGYPSFKRSWIIGLSRWIPALILKAVAKLPVESLKKVYYLSYHNTVGDYLFLRGFYAPDSIAKLLKISRHDVTRELSALPIHIPEILKHKPKSAISWMEANIYMKNQLLRDADFMSMDNSVEIRTPFLDLEFIQTVLNIKASLKFDRKLGKQLLIDAFSCTLPKEIWNRPKMGFTLPFAKWLRRIEQVNHEPLYADNPKSKCLYKVYKKGKLHWARLLVLYQVKSA